MTEANPTEGKSNIFRWFTGGVIVLMIVLMVFSSNTLNPQGRQGSDVLLGTADGGDVLSQNAHYATDLIERLQNIHVVVSPATPTSEPQLVPLLSAAWGDEVLRDMKANPEALFLALREARRVGPGVNPFALGPLEPEQQSPEQMGVFNSGRVDVDDLRPLPSSPLGQFRYQRGGPGGSLELRVVQRSNAGRMSEFEPNKLPPLEQQYMHAALNDFLALQAAASLPLNAVKPSAPMVDRFIAQNFQTFGLQLASIDAGSVLPQVPEPTDEQLRAQLAAYAANVPGRVSATNHFGFGYRVPERVKIELISYRREDVRKVVEAEKTPYEWEVAARIAYGKDPEAFAPPTTQPDAATAPATAPAAASFEAVRDRVIAATIDRATDQRAADIEKAIRSPMGVDYQMWANATGQRAAGATTGPSTAPAVAAPNTSLGVPYDSPEYLRRLAAAVQAKWKVLPTVEQYTDRPRGLNELSLLGGFNNATRELPPDLVRRTDRGIDTISGPQYAIGFTRDLLDARSLEVLGGLVLERLRPSERLESRRGENGSENEVFFFRVTEAERAHPATDIEPIREKLKSDWRVAEAQKLALERAQNIVAAVEQGTAFEAAVQAVAPGAPVIRADVGPFIAPPPEDSPLDLSMPAYAQFGRQLTDHLLGEKTTVAALSVPLAGKAYATQRLDMRGQWSGEEELRALRQMLRARSTMQMLLPQTDTNPAGLTSDDLAAAWLDSKRIFERTNYKPATEGNAAE